MQLFALERARLDAWLYQSDVERKQFDYREQERQLDVRGRTAVINVMGVLVPDLQAAWDRFNCATAYSHIEQQLDEVERKFADGEVDHLAVIFDSPGGATSGMQDCAGRLAASAVPTVAYVRGSCCSAAMYLAVGCDRIIASDMAAVGSIGVVCQVRSNRELMKQIGVETKTVRSPETPGKALEPGDDGFDEQMGAVVREATAAFYRWVAERRGLTGDLPTATGSGDVLSPRAALDLNLIDAIGSRADAIAPPTTEASVTDQEKIEQLETEKAELEKQNAKQAEDLAAMKRELDAAGEAGDGDEADDDDGDEEETEARIKLALDAHDRKFEARVSKMEAELLVARAGEAFGELLAKRLVTDTEKPRFLRDYRLAHRDDATDEDTQAYAEYAARQPLAPAKRTSHGETLTGEDPLSPEAVQAYADKHCGGDFTAALARMAATA